MRPGIARTWMLHHDNATTVGYLFSTLKTTVHNHPTILPQTPRTPLKFRHLSYRVTRSPTPIEVSVLRYQPSSDHSFHRVIIFQFVAAKISIQHWNSMIMARRQIRALRRSSKVICCRNFRYASLNDGDTF